MERIKDVLAREPGVEAGAVRVGGWVRTRRDSKAGFSFVEINDGSCLASLQVVAGRDLPNYERDVLCLSMGSSVAVDGVLVASPGAGQKVELRATAMEVIGRADPETYPLQKKEISYERLREIAHLRPRTNTFGAVLRIRGELAYAVHSFFRERGFICLHSPIITTSDCEGAGAMFRVTTIDPGAPPRRPDGAVDTARDFFGASAYLTVSGQLEAEACACGVGRVYTFGPTFRAENSNTWRHLAEFWMVEPEMAFADLDADAQLAESFIRALACHVLANCGAELEFFRKRVDDGVVKRLESAATKPFDRMTYTEAVERLKASDRKFEYAPEWGGDLQSEHERVLTEICGGAVVVTDFPASIKPFYMRRSEDGRTVAAMDVLAPGIGEIIGGSQREERLDALEQNMRERGMDPANYGWFLDLRRYGTVPHAGFGLGFERMVQFCTGMRNIRDVIPFPRTPGNAEF
ncbi:MAG: asparagine--tRNA ligase [Lentisphaerae bacterium]|nr:asparagine--tRNA ligase [Lentisphaerota bacterium]